jgi:hypothetical protein
MYLDLHVNNALFQSDFDKYCIFNTYFRKIVEY